jgi:type II secretory pathway pseudopilin PulG
MGTIEADGSVRRAEDDGAASTPAGTGPVGREGHGMRVLPWSGPGGWTSSPPVLISRRVGGTEVTEGGFTTVELMVALVVMAILLVISAPTFLGTTHAADDRSAQSNLATVLTDAQSQFQADGQTYLVHGLPDSSAFAGLLSGSQPSLSFKAGSAGPTGSSGSLTQISVAVSADGAGLVLAAFSVPGNCFYVDTNAATLSVASQAATPYTVTTAPTAGHPGSIALPATAGTTFVKVTGDVNVTDCNAYTPGTSGPPATIRYSTAGFPQ